MRIHVLQNFALEGPDNLQDWSDARGHRLVVHRLDQGAACPPPEEVDVLVVLGGPMNVYDVAEAPWLQEETAYLRRMLATSRPVLGVCLGAQLMSVALGGEVTQNPAQEIGWFPVQKTEAGHRCALLDALPDPVYVAHWHGDTFSIPDGCAHLLWSEACAHQAFLHGANHLALQFHLDWHPETLRNLHETFSPATSPDAPWIQSHEQMFASPERFTAAQRYLFDLLDVLLHVSGTDHVHP